MHKLKFNPELKNSQELLKLSNVSLVSCIPIEKGHNIYFKVECNNCHKIYDKPSYTFGITMCQCRKTINGAYNYRGKGNISSIYFNRIKERAILRNIDFLITPEQILDKFNEQKGKCALTGLDINIERNYKKYNKMTASLDRIDSKRSYTLDNIQWVHKDINRMKNCFDEDYFIYVGMIKNIESWILDQIALKSHTQNGKFCIDI